MKAALDNQTKFPLRDVKKIVYWVLRELDVDRGTLLVRVRKSRAGVHTHHGRFYPNARRMWRRVWRDGEDDRIIRPSLPPHVSHLIVARIPEATIRQHHRDMRGGPPPLDPVDWKESLICIVAHEATHFRQFLFPKKNRPRWSEVEAEWAEYRLLKRWRNL